MLDAAGERIGSWRASIDPEWFCEIRTIVVAEPGRGAGSWAVQSALERDGFRNTEGNYEDLWHHGMLASEYAESKRDA